MYTKFLGVSVEEKHSALCEEEPLQWILSKLTIHSCSLLLTQFHIHSDQTCLWEVLVSFNRSPLRCNGAGPSPPHFSIFFSFTTLGSHAFPDLFVQNLYMLYWFWSNTSELEQSFLLERTLNEKMATVQHCKTGNSAHPAALDPLLTTMSYSDQHLSCAIFNIDCFFFFKFCEVWNPLANIWNS